MSDVRKVNVTPGRQGFQETTKSASGRGLSSDGSYALGEWVTHTDFDGNPVVRAAFVDLGEGLNGDFDANDPLDKALLRIDFQVPAKDDWAEDTDPDDPDWATVQGETSVCTSTPVGTSPAQMRALLTRTVKDFNDNLRSDGSPRRAIRRAESLTDH